ncbi:sulfatase-like hydrolase/transferase [Bacillaceae bacterium SIJ1]|uniref:sulfatase-like hydrolase/transferase n=1 Tax=Litoribacterium kuwaitense TaxID=1398745 RepID=UPI0013E9C642|nr:sulfatase-like hydrolase/transferase [Litoribacterium kuwaitense]NGP45554.1 sulfatase-like hydrolase/transferase [Litoribacterium kuwaitense]
MGQKPNVLIIKTDQQSLWTLSCYGGTLVHTPHIDQLADTGAKFTNYFTNSAVCTPSRGSFITGRYPHHHGAFRNDQSLYKDEVTLAHVLKQNGYQTGYAGKWHLHGNDSPGWMSQENAMGFDDCKYMFNSGHFKEVVEHEAGIEVSYEIGDEETYMTDWLTQKALDYFAKQTKQHQPFFYMLSIPDPHQPFNVRPPYDTMYDPQDMPIPSTFDENPLPDWAEYGTWGREATFPLDLEDREERFRSLKAQYCGQVKCIDDAVGRMVHSLKELNLYDDTLIVFTTDHGEYMGEHGLMYKNNLYEAAYHIPLIIRWPEKVKEGTVVDRFVATVDFQQTLLGLLNLKPSGREQGRDASPFLQNENIPWEDEVFIHPSDVPRTGIFTPSHELAYVGTGWEGQEFADHILFDRMKDPMQMRNIFDDPEERDVQKHLTARIIRHHQALGSNPEILPKSIRQKMGDEQ